MLIGRCSATRSLLRHSSFLGGFPMPHTHSPLAGLDPASSVLAFGFDNEISAAVLGQALSALRTTGAVQVILRAGSQFDANALAHHLDLCLESAALKNGHTHEVFTWRISVNPKDYTMLIYTIVRSVTNNDQHQ